VEHLGLLRAAAGGTVFIEEISELSLDTQAGLLRAITEQTIRPVGAMKEATVNVRFIASIGCDCEEAIGDGRLSPELHRLSQGSVFRVPALRDRIEDIPLLIQHFIDLFNERLIPPILVIGIADDALAAMVRYSWPGNIRELRAAVESAFALSTSPVIQLADLPGKISGLRGSSERLPKVALGSFADAERDLMQRALEISGGDKSHTAKLLKITRKTLDATMAKYGF